MLVLEHELCPVFPFHVGVETRTEGENLSHLPGRYLDTSGRIKRMFSPDALRGLGEERAVTRPDETRQLSRLFLKRHERRFLDVLLLEGCKA